MRKRVWIFVSTVVLALVATTAALAFTHTGPFYDSAYNVQIWAYGTGIGGVSGDTPSKTADQISVPSGLSPGFEESALRDMGTCLECENWSNSPASLIPIGTDSYGSLKVATGISTRYFTIGANLGSPQTSASVTGEYLCGSGAIEVPLWTNAACGNLGGGGDGYNTNGNLYSSHGLPAGTTSQNYAQIGFSLTGCTASGSTAMPNEFTLIDQTVSEIPGTGNVASAVACVTSVWTQYLAMGGTRTGTFTYGALTYHVFHVPQADCQHAEFNTLNSSNALGSYPGNKCYIAYALDDDLRTALEHVFPVAFGTQTAITTRTFVLTTTPVAANLLRVRTFVDRLGQSYTDEWNCILQPNSYTCPSSVPVVTPPSPGCFNAPEPGSNESFADYKLRIQNDGYTGTFVEVNDPNYPVGGAGYPDNSAAAALSVGTSTGVGSMGGGGSVTMAYISSTGARVSSSSWRGASICPGTTTEVDIYDVPSSPGGTGGGVNTLPSVDFSPITSVSYGTAFPFGVFTWISNAFSPANCDSRTSCNYAPTFTLTKPGGGTIFVDLTSPTWVSTWRAPVFDVLEFLITLGAIWFLAFRVMGIGGGGNDE